MVFQDGTSWKSLLFLGQLSFKWRQRRILLTETVLRLLSSKFKEGYSAEFNADILLIRHLGIFLSTSTHFI